MNFLLVRTAVIRGAGMPQQMTSVCFGALSYEGRGLADRPLWAGHVARRPRERSFDSTGTTVDAGRSRARQLKSRVHPSARPKPFNWLPVLCPAAVRVHDSRTWIHLHQLAPSVTPTIAVVTGHSASEQRIACSTCT